MVMMPQPVAKAIRSVKTPKAQVIYLSPQGTPVDGSQMPGAGRSMSI